MSQEMPLRQIRFTEVFDASVKIEFNHAWSNGTGYFDNGVGNDGRCERPHVPSFPIGQTRGAVTAAGKRLLFIHTHLGMMVIFDRYTVGDNVFVFNADPRITRGQWIDGGAISNDTMLFLLGEPGSRGIRGGIADVIKDLRECIIDTLKNERALQE